MTIKGVIVGDIEAMMALRMSLSYLIQWVLLNSVVEVPMGLGHDDMPLTK